MGRLREQAMRHAERVPAERSLPRKLARLAIAISFAGAARLADLMHRPRR